MTSIIVMYCDTVIFVMKKIKSYIQPNTDLNKDQIINMSQDDAYTFLNENIKRRIYVLDNCKRPERHKLYKLLKGKNSPFNIYSVGNEDELTNKKLIVMKKS